MSTWESLVPWLGSFQRRYLAGVEDEGFLLELACGMIGDTPQRVGIQVVHREPVQE